MFLEDVKFPRDDAFLIFAGNLFHKVGAATLNAFVLKVFVLMVEGVLLWSYAEIGVADMAFGI